MHTVYVIVWRSLDGALVKTAQYEYSRMVDAEAALATLHRYTRDLIPTIEPRKVITA